MALDNIKCDYGNGTLSIRIGSVTAPQFDILEAAVKLAGNPLNISAEKISAGENPLYQGVVIEGYYTNDWKEGKKVAGGLLKILAACISNEAQEYR